MNKKQKEILDKLAKLYPKPKCALHYSTPLELSVAVILSAQCTDKRVNIVTPKLFNHCKCVQDYADIPLKDLEKLIFSTGFYKNKAKSIQGLAKKVLDTFNGEIPQDMKSLTSLPGVGRKTANVIQQEAFGITEGVVVDTHVLRISFRLGFASKSQNAEIKERELMKVLPKKYWFYFSHYMILLGRSFCVARKPDCVNCPLKDICPRRGVL
ncbi:endonuclease III [Candidatus Peregrinibacteria bacterium]|jgi:endonuclease III|nr:endonuclease III [Candidatus Peregrinibacteria bacterium]